MGDHAALDGMARRLLRRGVTSFLPTAVTAPLGELAAFAERVRAWLPDAPADGAEPLGFNLEGPFLAAGPARGPRPAPSARPGRRPSRHSSRSSTGSACSPSRPSCPARPSSSAGSATAAWRPRSATRRRPLEEARAGYAAGATSTTHLFNAMSGLDHRAPGLALAALLDDAVYVELIADGIHVDPALWPLITRLKPADRLLLVSDAIALAGMGDGRGRIGGLEVEVVGPRVTLAGTSTLAGIGHRPRHAPSATWSRRASRCPQRSPPPVATHWPCSASTDRGRIAVGQRADLVELDPTPSPSGHARRDLVRRRLSRPRSHPPRRQRGGIASNVRSMSSSIRIVASATTSR